jgi:hypothetical protein
MRILFASVTTFVLVAAICGTPLAAQGQWPSGSWQSSCRSANVNGPTFSAQCQTGGGGWQRSSINLNQCPGRLVGNNNGRLFCEGGGGNIGDLPAGSWRNSCRNARMNGDVVHANCNTGSGYSATWFAMRQCPSWALGNRNGSLFCEGNAPGIGATVMPGGSWQNSCRNPRWERGFFVADCNAGNGAYRRTAINVNQCPRRLVGNRNGSFFCEG